MDKLPDYIMPDKEELQLQYRLKWKEQFLAANNLKVGDTVIMSFKYNMLGSGRSGRENDTEYKIAEGILKEYKNGALYVESIEDFTFYHQTSNGRSGRDYRTWYEQTIRKSILILGNPINTYE